MDTVVVDAFYFSTVGVPIVEGRAFTEDGRSSRAAC